MRLYKDGEISLSGYSYVIIKIKIKNPYTYYSKTQRGWHISELSSLRLVVASLNICYDICQTSTVQGFVHCRSSVTKASQVSRLKTTGLLCVGMDEKTGLQCEGGNARCIAWSHFERRRPHLNEWAEAETSNSRSSQPSGSLRCGWRWHFRKPALSTDQFKLKVISRS